jgi:hypothetical protein
VPTPTTPPASRRNTVRLRRTVGGRDIGAQKTGWTSPTWRAVLAMLSVVVLTGLAAGIARVEWLRRREVEVRTAERGGTVTPAVAMSRAESLATSGRYDEAIAVLQRAVRTGPYDESLH